MGEREAGILDDGVRTCERGPGQWVCDLVRLDSGRGCWCCGRVVFMLDGKICLENCGSVKCGYWGKICR